MKRFLISSFRRVLYVVCFLLGNKPASEFYMPTFRNTLFHLHRQAHSTRIYLPMKVEQTECSETSAYKLQTPGNYPKESIQQQLKRYLLHCHFFSIVYDMSRNEKWTWRKSLFWNTLYEGSINSSSRVRLHGNSTFGWDWRSPHITSRWRIIGYRLTNATNITQQQTENGVRNFAISFLFFSFLLFLFFFCIKMQNSLSLCWHHFLTSTYTLVMQSLVTSLWTT